MLELFVLELLRLKRRRLHVEVWSRVAAQPYRESTLPVLLLAEPFADSLSPTRSVVFYTLEMSGKSVDMHRAVVER